MKPAPSVYEESWRLLREKLGSFGWRTYHRPHEIIDLMQTIESRVMYKSLHEAGYGP